MFIIQVPSVAAAAISDALSDRSDHAHPLVPIQYVGKYVSQFLGRSITTSEHIKYTDSEIIIALVVMTSP